MCVLERQKGGQYLAVILYEVPWEDMHFSSMHHIYHISIFPVCSRLVIMSTEDCGSHPKHPMTTGTSHPSIKQKTPNVDICPVLGWVLLQQLIVIINKKS